jgi:hypothetical protein
MLVESGVYVLGALSPAQRQSYERHLSTCAECRAEVGDLAVLPGLLGRLDETSVDVDDAIQAPPTVLPAVVRRVRRRRRNQRFAAITGAVAAACLALIVGLTMPTHSARPAPQAATTVAPSSSAAALHPMTPVSKPSLVSASVGLASFSGGTRITGTCTYQGLNDRYPGPLNFKLYVVPRNGDREVVETWSAKPGDAVPLDAMTWWPMSDLASVQLVGPSGAVQLQYTLA